MEDRVSNIYNWSKVNVSREKRGSEIIVIQNWCHNNIGKKWMAMPYEECDGVWTCLWDGFRDGYVFSFKYEEDAVMFALNWI